MNGFVGQKAQLELYPLCAWSSLYCKRTSDSISEVFGPVQKHEASQNHRGLHKIDQYTLLTL